MKHVAFDAIDDILLNDKHAVMEEVEIPDNSTFIGETLNSLNFAEYNLTLIGIVSKNDVSDFIFNPDKENYKLRSQDILIVIGYYDSIMKFKSSILSKRSKIFRRVTHGK